MKFFFTFFIIYFFIANALLATVITSAGSGLWSANATWVGGVAPTGNQDIIIATGHTVTMDVFGNPAGVRSLTIQSGATLINNYSLKISINSLNITNYTNNGIHTVTGGGTAIYYDFNNGGFDGNGVLNGDIEINSGGPTFLSSCHITINGNIITTGNTSCTITNNGFDTLNGNLEFSNGTDFDNYGHFYQSGNTILYNNAWFHNYNTAIYFITGNIDLYNPLFYGGFYGNWGNFQNFGSVTIGGNVKGDGGVCMFIQESGAIAKFGGQVFPSGFDGQLLTVGISPWSGLSVEPNTIEYNGGAAQLIKTPGNDSVFVTDILSGGAPYDFSPGIYSNLTISNPLNVSLNDDVTVNGTLNFTSGKIILGTKNITLSTPTAITGYNASNYVVTDNTGYLQINGITTTAMEFPIGISTGSYTPANIINNGIGATATNFSARVADKVYSSQGNVQVADMVDRTWYITGSGGTANATLTLQWNAAEEFGTFDRTNCGISHYSAPNWGVPPTFSAASGLGPYTQSRSGISSFSPFAVEAVNHPLPIELLDFTGEVNAEGKVVLSWTTVTETNNDFFTVERVTPSVLWTSPPNGGETSVINFVPIGILKGAGNSAMSLKYYLLDESPFSEFIPTKEGERIGVRYYRLKQTDFDGKCSYSPIISIEIKHNRMFSMYPNPTGANVNLNINSEKEEPLVLSVLDNLGRTIIAKEEHLMEGQNYFNVDVSALSSGVYTLQMITDSGMKEEKALMINK